MWETVMLLSAAYLVGSVPSGYLLVRAFRRRDVRAYGSHNVGAINVFRVGGARLGIATLLADAGKGLGVVLAAHALGAGRWEGCGAAFLVMVGHAYSAWFFLREGRFSEGKSVASGLGVLVGLAGIGALSPLAVAVPVGVWAAGLLAPRLLTGRWGCISPATMAATVSIPITVWSTGAAPPGLALSLCMAALVLTRHKNNIRRLRAGTEPRLGERLRLPAGSPAPKETAECWPRPT